MRQRSSSSLKKFAIAFFVLAVLSVAVAISYIFIRDEEWLQSMIIMWISAVIWVLCGILVLRSAKKQKEEEAKKVKVNAFNYAKIGKKK